MGEIVSIERRERGWAADAVKRGVCIACGATASPDIACGECITLVASVEQREAASIAAAHAIESEVCDRLSEEYRRDWIHHATSDEVRRWSDARRTGPMMWEQRDAARVRVALKIAVRRGLVREAV